MKIFNNMFRDYSFNKGFLEIRRMTVLRCILKDFLNIIVGSYVHRTMGGLCIYVGTPTYLVASEHPR